MKTPAEIFLDAWAAGARVAADDLAFHQPVDLRSQFVRVRTTGLVRGRGQRRNRRNRIGLSVQRLHHNGITYSARLTGVLF